MTTEKGEQNQSNKIINTKNSFKSDSITKNKSSSHRLSTGNIYRNNLSESQVMPSSQSISDFYAGKSVFITGGTGFIGRILIERLLYTCKDIEKIYVLIRPKRDCSLQERLHNLLHNPVFTKLKETRPRDLNKVVPIAGDVADDRLGISLDDEETLTEKVSVIFHSAANVKLRTPLLELMQANYEGTKHVMELGKKIKHLDVFVYVSTAYHNAHPVIEERTIQPPRRIEDVYKVLANHSNDSDEVKNMLYKWGNSYVFSKNMAEAYVASNHGNMPTVIVRPSMVSSVYKDPLVGYSDSWVAGTVLLCDIASGLTKVIYGKSNVTVDIIPADYVCNFLIIAAAKNSKNAQCNVYNHSPEHSNPIDWGRLSQIYIQEGKKHGYVIMPFPMAIFTTNSWATPVLVFVMQTVPAFIADTWIRVTGGKPRYIKLHKQAASRAIFTRAVTESSWDIRTTRARELISTLDDQDRLTFPCDPVSIDWNEYVPIYCKGVKDYMLGYKSKL